MRIPAKYWIPGAVVGAFIATEVTLRLAFGLGNPVLVQADANTGYRFQPNQKIFRFGKHIQYNQYSQRSEPITLAKPPGKLRILMTGDSVLNGGNPLDQSQTITELFEAKLSASGHPAEVLNASAGSWGIGNQLAYLQKFGTFNADAVILQIGSHDLTQLTSTSDVVGNYPAYPDRPPVLAMQEAWTRYAWPQLAYKLGFGSPVNEIPAPKSSNPDRQFKENMESLQQIVKLVRAKNIPVFVLYTPNIDDLLPKLKVSPYKTEFLRLLKNLQVPIIDTQSAWSRLPQPTVQTYFRDWVHLNFPANQAIVQQLFGQLCLGRQLPSCSSPPPSSPVKP